MSGYLLDAYVMLTSATSIEAWTVNGRVWQLRVPACSLRGNRTRFVGESAGSLFATVCGGLHYVVPNPPTGSSVNWLTPQGSVETEVALPDSIVISTSIGGESPTIVMALATR